MTNDNRQKNKYKLQNELLKSILKSSESRFCEYQKEKDVLVVYDEEMYEDCVIRGFIRRLQKSNTVHPDDIWKLHLFFYEESKEEAEVRICRNDHLTRLRFQALNMEVGEQKRLPVLIRDITQERCREALLEEQAKKDSLTLLYNHFFGKELINEYLKRKDPYSSCGMMVMDVDYFKYANDMYGHLFGDQVLVEIAKMLRNLFRENAVLMRAGGDEFVVFLKNTGHAGMVRSAMRLVEGVRSLSFEGKDFRPTCSVGVCCLSENVAGYSYNQLFENADWALYRAKENGRNRYVFCDNLQRFELKELSQEAHGNIDIRYLRNDIISTAFEIFEKTSSFPVAIELLMEVIGTRFQLDRITVIRTDIKEQNTGRQYQWISDYAPEVLREPGSFTKEDFLTLFQSYDEYQTTVLQCDNMGMYSPQGAALLMQGEAKTVLYAAMYVEGKYTGAISYVVCREKRYWSKQNRKELGEVTKIISAHLARSQSADKEEQNRISWAEYDSLTGLISFSRFRMEAEHLIVGEYANSHLMVYSDFEGFKYFNQKCGYRVGDQLLKEFSSFFIEKAGGREVYFTRVVSDQFLMLLPFEPGSDFAAKIDSLNKEFERVQSEKYQGARIRIRSGIYVIEEDCGSASAAIDAANYARKQVLGSSSISVRVYDETLRRKQQLENEIINGIDEAMREQRFKIYLQPKISLVTGEVVGAEALVRWKTTCGQMLSPQDFIPLCESSGRIEELDFYVFEHVARFLAHNQAMGRKQLPISVNASIFHTANPQAIRRYIDILEKYQVSPEYVEIELTETATVEEYESARWWFQELRKKGIKTSIDDFGSGYSVLNSVIDIPVDTVKLDRAFIQNCVTRERGIFFLHSMIKMINGLGYRVICEGIETKEQAEIMKNAGCEEVQGFLFSKPLPIDAYEDFVYGAKNASPLGQTDI